MIILDRSLRAYGTAAGNARGHLIVYVEEAIANPYRGDQALQHQKSLAAQYLDTVGGVLTAIKPTDRFHETMMVDMHQQYHSLIEQRWKIVEQSESAIPGPLIGMLVAWMTLI